MSTRVYMGGLSRRVRERDVEKLTRKYGRVREVSLKNGYGFVEFDDYRDADDACYDLNGKEFMGERVTVELARGTPHGRDRERWGTEGGNRRDRSPRRRRDSRDSRRPGWLDKYGPPTRTNFRLIVENLSSRVSWQDLKDYMRQAGVVTYADAHKNRRNEGCVEFANEDDLKTAMEKLDGTELNGRKIKLVPDRKQKRSSRSPRSRSRSKGDGRKGSRSNSRSRSKSRGDKHSRSRSRSKSRSRSRSNSRSPPARSSSIPPRGDGEERREDDSREESNGRRRRHSSSRSSPSRSPKRLRRSEDEEENGGSEGERPKGEGSEENNNKKKEEEVGCGSTNEANMTANEEDGKELLRRGEDDHMSSPVKQEEDKEIKSSDKTDMVEEEEANK